MLCILCAVVIEELIVCAELCVNLAHILLNNRRNCVVVLVASLTVLEEDIVVLVRTTHYGMLGVKSSVSECSNCIHIAHFLKILIIPNFDLLDLVRCTETVEEVDERNSALNCCKVSNCAEIHNLLRVCFCKHCETCLTAGINV